MKPLLNIISIIFCLFFIASCAVEQAPLGGPKDEIPPSPDTLNSTANKQLFFKKQKIELVFDEWVKLKNPGQIIVSPPLEYGLKTKLKKKSLFLEFEEEEELLENTTYTINLGQSIVDYTVGNPIENYTFVFSTGSFLDSMYISGVVRDDLTGDALEDIVVSIYAELSDTAFYTKRPLYFAVTDEEGKYQIKNMRSDTFQVYALGDKNLNYFKDQESESVGFLKDYIILDSSYTTYTNIGHFLPEPTLRITNKTHQYGQLKLTLNKKIDSLSYYFEPVLEEKSTLFLGDSLYLWYKNDIDRKMIINTSEEKNDTINLIIDNDSIKYNKSLKILDINANPKKRLSINDSLEITFNSSIVNTNIDSISIKDTSGKELKIDLIRNTDDPRKVSLYSKWLESEKYELQINPGSFLNQYSETNDTINKLFFTSTMEDLGEIIFTLDSLNSDSNYIIELTKGKETISRFVKGKSSHEFQIRALEKGKYTVRVIEDINRNNRWDVGNYKMKQYSEKWISKELEDLKAGWTLEVDINGEEFK